ncbi:MAG: hypothetical protein EOP48_05505 [Sphingobacteriales bacterium]|nr:MAG: hypothetical protein EOP48_05505 [Sphingobacteriales bacterium]
MHLKISLTASFIVASLLCMAQKEGDTSAIGEAKAWWNAVTFGDTAYLKTHSTAGLTVTFNSGRSFNHAEIIRQVATHDPKAPIKAEWSQAELQSPSPTTAIVTNRVIETVGKTPHIYKFITVLIRNNSGWIVAAAQSTREIQLAPAIPVKEAGNLVDFAGSYKTPAGLTLTTVIRDTSLVLVEPSGAETRLEAIGPGIFEIPKILSAGNVRFVFSRDESGKVVSVIRVAHLITTMKRLQ